MDRTALKQLLGDIPLTAEAYWYLRQAGKPIKTSFSLQRLDKELPAWSSAVVNSARRSQSGKHIMIFGVLHYWISHAALLGMALAGQGHQVSLAFLPYARWQTPLNRFDLRRQNLYARSVLGKASPWIRAVSFLDSGLSTDKLPADIREAVAEISLRDTQYTLQVEVVNSNSDLYLLRLERNTQAACAALDWMNENRPEMVIIPNGSILEFGVVNQVARFLGIPVVTYEFGEQRQRIWLAQDAEVMRQQTDDLWKARAGQELTEEQLDQVRTLFAARQRASLWENFARRWQGVPSTGGSQVRATLGLDSRPVVLLATNVIGDSLTLGRQVFSDSMTEWLVQTVRYFSRFPEAQLVVRIHPGELVTKGPSVASVVQGALPEIPAHIHLIPADAQVNTYDIVEIADLGLVYTTTVGMEMAMTGVPVIAVGQTHYRGKGFTLDPNSWEAYFDLLGQVLAAPEQFRLSREQVERAWEYAYRFFFEYPHPFPWHLVQMWNDIKEWPLERFFSEAGQARFSRTFAYLAGEKVVW